MAEEQSSQAGAGAVEYASPSTPRHHEDARLSRHDAALLALRLIALYVLMWGIAPLAQIVAYFLDRRSSSAFLSWEVAYLAVILAVGVTIWVLSDRGARLLFSRSFAGPSLPSGTPLPIEDLQAAAFAIIGVLLVVAQGIPGLFGDLFRHAYEQRRQKIERPTADLVTLMFPHILQLILGVWLFIGSKRLAAYWRRVREGRPAAPLAEDDGPL